MNDEAPRRPHSVQWRDPTRDHNDDTDGSWVAVYLLVTMLVWLCLLAWWLW